MEWRKNMTERIQLPRIGEAAKYARIDLTFDVENAPWQEIKDIVIRISLVANGSAPIWTTLLPLPVLETLGHLGEEAAKIAAASAQGIVDTQVKSAIRVALAKIMMENPYL